MRKIIIYMLTVLIAFSMTKSPMAEEKMELKIPYTFEPGQPARASEVNENFDTLKKAIEELRQENRELRAKLDEQAEQLEQLPMTILGLGEQGHLLMPMQNAFDLQGEVVLDHATDLMWQQAGSPEELSVEKALRYIASLNEQKLGGYDDWRLPTIPELLTLVTEEKNADALYLDPIFDKTQIWCLSSNPHVSGMNWSVNFAAWNIYLDEVRKSEYVRAVRDYQQPRETLTQKSFVAASNKLLQTSASISLRSEPKPVSIDDVEQEFGVRFVKQGEYTFKRPLTYVTNQFEVQGDLVVDYTTGLMWQRFGSKKLLNSDNAQKYIEELNQQHFAGHSDWRFPTIPELLSLLEPNKQSNDLYIDTLLCDTPTPDWNWFWSSDTQSQGSVWGVSFRQSSVEGYIMNTQDSGGYVRAVRSLQK